MGTDFWRFDLKKLFAERTLIDRIKSSGNPIVDLGEKSISDYRQHYRALLEKTNSFFSGKPRKWDGRPGNWDGSLYEDIYAYLRYAVDEEKISEAYKAKLRSALLYQIYEEAEKVLDMGLDISNYQDVYEKVRKIPVRDTLAKTDKTNSGSIKFFDRQFFEYCVNTLSKKIRPTKSETALKHFLNANIRLGLRPHEWMGTVAASNIEDGRQMKMLVVENSKNSNARANGEHRELLLDNLPNQILQSISEVIRIYSETATNYRERFGYDEETAKMRGAKSLQRNMTKVLHTLEKNYLKIRPAEKEKVKGTTLYSIRHQAVANAKAADVDDIEIAAVFGHISVRTSKERYGRKKRGWGGKFPVRASEKSMLPVIERLERGYKPKTAYTAAINKAPDSFWDI